MSPRDLLNELGDVDAELLSKRDRRRLRRAQQRSRRVDAKRDMKRRVRAARREQPRTIVFLTVAVIAFGAIFVIGYLNRPMPADDAAPTAPTPETTVEQPAPTEHDDHPTPHVVAANWATAFFGGSPWAEFVDENAVADLEELHRTLFADVAADTAAVSGLDWGETSNADGVWTGLAEVRFVDGREPVTLRISVNVDDAPFITVVTLEEASDSA